LQPCPRLRTLHGRRGLLDWTVRPVSTPPKRAGRARPRLREHPVEFFLNLFGDVRPGEAMTVLLLALNVFLIMSAYYLLKVAREPLILLGGGAEVKSYASAGQSFLLVFIATLYGWLAARMSRVVLISVITLVFIANLIVFCVLGVRGVPLGVPFFLWVGIFNVVTISQFWSFAADTYTEEQGKRLFPIVGIGSSIGAVGGAWLGAPLIGRGSPFFLMVVAAGILLGALAVTHVVHRVETRSPATALAVQAPVARGNAFALVFRDPYLLAFALLVLVLNFVTKSGDYILDRMLVVQAPAYAHALGIQQSAYIGQFKAHYFEWINMLGVVMQMFFVSRVIKYVGLRAALVLVPLASVGAYGAAIFFPLLGVLFVGRVVESSLDYSLSNTTRQSLWLVTSREAKYKAKQLIDTIFKRAGDTSSAAVVWLAAHFALSTQLFLAINVALCFAWVALAVILGRGYVRRSGSPLTR
jgi:AAA family ATP:ADP antiporter